MRIIFVRHGEPDYATDSLTETGILQARAVAQRLKDEGIEEIYCSSMGRAIQTARETAKILDLPIKTLDYMKELRWGSIDGKPIFADGHPWDIVDEMVRQGYDLTAPDWRDNKYFSNNIVTEEADNVAAKTDDWLETLGYKREGNYYRCIREGNDQHTVALFSHGGSSSAAMGHILNLQFPYCCSSFHIEFTGITILRFDRNPGSIAMPCMELVNDSMHIQGETYHRLRDM
jgi:probable phosphoglycerate mutase